MDLRRTALALAMFGMLDVSACGGRSQDHRRIAVDVGNAGMSGGGMGTAGTRADHGGRGGAGTGGRGGASDEGGEGGEDAGAGQAGMAGAAGEAPTKSCDAADYVSGALELVSVTPDCIAADGDSTFSRLSRDGRYVAFDSDAPNLVPNDLNGKSDVFLFDSETRKLELISHAHGTDAPGGGYSWLGALSDDGRFVGLMALSYDLVSTSVSEGIWVYLHDRQAGTTRHFGANYACAYWLDMSGDADLLVSEGFSNCQGALEDDDFESVVEHAVSGANRHIGTYGDLTDNYQPAISRDGRFILWGTRPPGTRGQHVSRLQLYDRNDGSTETLPLYSYHYESTDISDSGDIIAFVSNGQVYRYARDINQLSLASAAPDGTEGDDFSEQVSLSGDGRHLVFRSQATNLVPGDTNGVADIFLFDADNASIQRVSVAADGTQADDESNHPWMASDGSRVSFSSKARNLSKLSQAGNFQTYARRVER